MSTSRAAALEQAAAHVEAAAAAQDDYCSGTRADVKAARVAALTADVHALLSQHEWGARRARAATRPPAWTAPRALLCGPRGQER
jgi:hypothetical protein